MCKICEQFMDTDFVSLDLGEIDMVYDGDSDAFFLDCYDSNGAFETYIEIQYCPFCGTNLKNLKIN